MFHLDQTPDDPHPPERPRHGLWDAEDPALARSAAEGEQIISGARAVLCLLLLVTSTLQWSQDPDQALNVARFALALFATLSSWGVYLFLRRHRLPPWFGFFSTALDVTAVSTVLLVFLFTSGRTVAFGGTATLDLYFLAVVASCFRYDARVCVSAGIIALIQYAALVALSWWLPDPFASTANGHPDLITLVNHAILLALAIGLAAGLVSRARRQLLTALRDPLTGLGNRAYFEEVAQTELARCARAGRPCVLAVLDVDRFKAINDTIGHLNGDLVLRHLGQLLLVSTRRGDCLARWGGEEFLILLPNVDLDQGRTRLERLCRAVEDSRVSLPGRIGAIQITLSAGITAQTTGRVELRDLMQRADELLYRAKAEGRNRVVTEDSPENLALSSGAPN